jgi:tRNA modification GTPase
VTPPPVRADAAVLTATGRGAIAVVAIWGRDALRVADAVFVPNRSRPFGETRANRPRLGRLGGPDGEEVVAVAVGDPIPRVEIHCHGGEQAVRSLLARLTACGATMRAIPEAVRAFADTRLAAEAWLALAEAPTEPAAAILLDQAQGAFREEIERVDRDLAADRTSEAVRVLETLIARGSVGIRLRRGWTIALVGRPNVGKSRLLNALAGHERAIVSPLPGTTRDVVSLRSALEGWPVELLDTAGRRDALDALEVEGIDRGRARQQAADLVIAVLDRSVPLTNEDRAVLAEPSGAVRVANKVDLPPAWDELAIGALPISADQGCGLNELVRAIVQRIVPDPPAPGAGVPFELHHLTRLRRCRALLMAGRSTPGRAALRALLR